MEEDPFEIVGTLQAQAYRVERVVAEGGFGVVYRAHHEAFRAPVALKCLKVPGGLSAEQRQSFLEKFREEAELLFRLSASIQEVVRPLHFGVLETKGFVPFLALEWLEGQTLDAYVERRAIAGEPPLGLRELVELLTPLARALAKAHHFPGPDGAIAIIHRDLKPENVFLVGRPGEFRPKILDFGIARVRSASNAIVGLVTRQDAMQAFSPGYAAPEQWDSLSFGAPGPWTDVYGLAITLTHALIGRMPIDGDLKTMGALALDAKHRPSPRRLGAPIPDAAERAFVRALAVHPRERTASIDAFWAELEKAVGVATKQAGRGSAPSPHRAGADEASEPPPSSGALPKLPSLAPPPLSHPTPAPPPLGRSNAAPRPLSGVVHAAAPASLPGDAPRMLSSGVELGVERPTLPRPRPQPSISTSPHRQLHHGGPLLDRLAGPAKLLALALVVAGADVALRGPLGEPYSFEGVRPLWVAIALASSALLWGVARLASDD